MRTGTSPTNGDIFCILEVVMKILYFNVHSAVSGSCPKCGRAITIHTSNGRAKCAGCGAMVVVKNGQIVGWQ